LKKKKGLKEVQTKKYKKNAAGAAICNTKRKYDLVPEFYENPKNKNGRSQKRQSETDALFVFMFTDSKF
jgi:hypothetical protein